MAAKSANYQQCTSIFMKRSYAETSSSSSTPPKQDPQKIAPNLFSILQGSGNETTLPGWKSSAMEQKERPAPQRNSAVSSDVEVDPLLADVQSQMGVSTSSSSSKKTPATRAAQIRERVKMYNQMLSRQPTTLTVQFSERRTNSFVTFFLGKEPKMALLGAYSLGKLLKVTHKQRRSPQNTKIFVENVMRRFFPRYMVMTKAVMFNIRIKGTRKVARPLLAEVRMLLQDQMKEVRETGFLSHPLWTLGSIKNVTPYDMGSHKKRKRWRHL
eukprot:CAMPEP_0117446434 /NCGR_PEP_ID=MMETSP0759-20121206/6339_1 /TAXON_ID=63605 /ORGANISM="Percolomonas cosmopolitus, Strain WS" /LENGTH=269 /DNA_ID=CAMNT_0005238701 /DNA_START=204 /DNA_END=1013 /DNA_ORIENTATION=+